VALGNGLGVVRVVAHSSTLSTATRCRESYLKRVISTSTNSSESPRVE
jgi:hypothetical protein